jgi:8-oxo-dGTP pyrophosphatase MutT (NUDIX family)
MSPYYRRLRSTLGHDLLLVPGVAAVIHDVEGRLLLQERASNEGWSLPGGAIEPGETPEQALLREVLEETCLDVAAARLLGVFGGQDYRWVYPNGDAVEYVVSVYRCVVLREVARERDPETKSLQYFARRDMPPLAVGYPASVLFAGL